MELKTGCWFDTVPEGHTKVGISRGVPRRMAAGYRIYKKLAPGPWFNSVGADEYYQRYRTEILAPLDPRAIAAELVDLAHGGIPVMMCYERNDGALWCHRAMAAEWLAEAIGCPVPECGCEGLSQHEHPMMPKGLRRNPAPVVEAADLTFYVGREAMIEGEMHRVVGLDPQQKGRVIIAVGDRQFPTGIDTLKRHFDTLL